MQLKDAKSSVMGNLVAIHERRLVIEMNDGGQVGVPRAKIKLLGLDVTFEDTSDEEGGITVESSGSNDCGEAFKSTDLGVTGGIGFEWQPGGDPDDDTSEGLKMIGDVSGLKVSLELLYTVGLQSIVSADSGSDLGLGDDLKNRAFSIWLGGTLPIGG